MQNLNVIKKIRMDDGGVLTFYKNDFDLIVHWVDVAKDVNHAARMENGLLEVGGLL